jgi:hypothetical protein
MAYVQRSAIRILFLARLSLIVASLATGSLADLRSSTAARACCAKTHNQCAGLSTPDDCCKRMGHTTAGSLAGTLSAAQPLVVAATGVVAWLPATLTTVQGSSNVGFAFKRPHDPPHLHSFSLLI